MESAESPYCVCNRKYILERPDCVPSSQIFKKFEMWPTKFPLTAARSNSNIFYNIMLQHPQKNMPLLPLTLSSALQPLQSWTKRTAASTTVLHTSKHQQLGKESEKLPLFAAVPRHCLEDSHVPDCPELPKERRIFIMGQFSAFLPLVKQKIIGWHCKDKAAL